MATVTPGTVTVGSRIDDIESRGVPPGRVQQAPPTVSAPLHCRQRVTVQRAIRLIWQGMQHLCRVLTQRHCLVRLGVRPATMPKSGDSGTRPIDDLSHCLKSL